MKRNLTKVLLLAGCLLSEVLMSGCTEKAQANEKVFATGDTVELTFITIGKGDAFLIKTPQNTHYMYDTGKKEDYEQIKQVLETKHVSEFKGIFLSHGHKDHAGNVKHIIKEYPVETIYLSEKNDDMGKFDRIIIICDDIMGNISTCQYRADLSTKICGNSCNARNHLNNLDGFDSN